MVSNGRAKSEGTEAHIFAGAHETGAAVTSGVGPLSLSFASHDNDDIRRFVTGGE